MPGDMPKVIKGKPTVRYGVKRAKYGWHGGKKLKNPNPEGKVGA